jgi:uncharacterized membrane protein YwzB
MSLLIFGLILGLILGTCVSVFFITMLANSKKADYSAFLLLEERGLDVQ